jgi:hypothetical protein
MRDAFSGSLVVLYVALLVFFVACSWRVFTKAGKPGWAAIVPIYNLIVMLEMVGRPQWWVLLYFVPLVNIVVGIILTVELAKSFGQGIGFAVGILLLPIVFWPMLAFGAARYLGPGAARGVQPAVPA